MRRVYLAAVLLAGLGGSAPAQSPAEAKAVAVVDQMIQAMGGPEAWGKMHYLRFDWVVEKDGRDVIHTRHLWDCRGGRYRVEWTTPEGAKLAALFDIQTRAGRVQRNGEPARDEDEQKYLDQAYGRFINDSYWLLMPWKLKDPGVKLEYVGPRDLEGKKYDLLHVSFDHVGLTPGDHYWVWANRRTHLLDRWAYFLESFEGTPSEEKAKPWEWRNWQEVGGGVRLAREKVQIGEKVRIHFPVLGVLPSVDSAVFESFETAMPEPGP